LCRGEGSAGYSKGQNLTENNQQLLRVKEKEKGDSPRRRTIPSTISASGERQSSSSLDGGGKEGEKATSPSMRKAPFSSGAAGREGEALRASDDVGGKRGGFIHRARRKRALAMNSGKIGPPGTAETEKRGAREEPTGKPRKKNGRSGKSNNLIVFIPKRGEGGGKGGGGGAYFSMNQKGISSGRKTRGLGEALRTREERRGGGDPI